MAKRGFDILVSVVALVLLALPFALIAVWIRWDSPGPAFYRQPRAGRRGVPFRIHKFRTTPLASYATGAPGTVGQESHLTRVAQ